MPDATRPVLPLHFNAAGTTDIGQGRRHNEDMVLLRPDLNLYLLADGAGGHNAGNVASALATTSIAEYFEATEADAATQPDIDEFGLPTAARRLAIAIQRANRDIIEIAETSNKRKGMGTTIVAVTLSAQTGAMQLAHVGDSRCYRLRNGYLELLTQDHSLINDVLELKPDMEAAALKRLPRNVITRALGMEESVRVSVRTFHVAHGDRYLLCSDGLTDVLDTDQLTEVLRLGIAPDEQVRLLIDMANAAGAQDNIAALVISCEMAPGVATSPIRRAPPSSQRPPPLPRATRADDAPAVDPDASSPEIVIVGHEPEPELEWSSQIHVVPAESASEGLFHALDGFVGTTAHGRAARKPPPLPTRAARCGECGQALPADAQICPHCGAARGASPG